MFRMTDRRFPNTLEGQLQKRIDEIRSENKLQMSRVANAAGYAGRWYSDHIHSKSMSLRVFAELVAAVGGEIRIVNIKKWEAQNGKKDK